MGFLSGLCSCCLAPNYGVARAKAILGRGMDAVRIVRACRGPEFCRSASRFSADDVKRRYVGGIATEAKPVLARRPWKLNKKPLRVAQHSRIERKDPGASVAGRPGYSPTLVA
jgi:hypothetical protein